MNGNSQIILAIESAICGGSISLLRDGVEVANWIGSSDVSKAEDLLANIDTLLTGQNISRKEISLIAVSAGPGSFTGIRIGLATALGIKAGLGIEMSSETALRAMVFTQAWNQKFTAALPIGRNAVCVQAFQRSDGEVAALDQPRTITEDEFRVLIKVKNDATFILHSALYATIEPSIEIKNFGANIALAIAHICRENAGTIVEPLFISKSF